MNPTRVDTIVFSTQLTGKFLSDLTVRLQECYISGVGKAMMRIGRLEEAIRIVFEEEEAVVIVEEVMALTETTIAAVRVAVTIEVEAEEIGEVAAVEAKEDTRAWTIWGLRAMAVTRGEIPAMTTMCLLELEDTRQGFRLLGVGMALTMVG